MGTIARAVKGLPFPGYGGGYGGSWQGGIGSRFPIFRGMPGERDWSKLIGDGSQNSIVTACVLWICRNFTQAPMIVVEEGEDDIMHKVKDHSLPKLWKRPNPFFSGRLLSYGLLTSFVTNGNGYIRKVRSEAGKVVELWWVPHFMMQPRWEQPNHYIDWYDYIVDGQRYPVPVEDVYHLRYGLDPTNIRLGLSPLASLFRELGIDEEASRFSASILYNLGVPGIVISPDKDMKGELDEQKRLAIKATFKQSFGGDNRGDPIVLSKPTNVTQFGFSPAELDLGDIRDIPEERVTAQLGIPPAVVGFQQKNSKVGATRGEERDQAFENNIIPTQGLVADEASVQILPDFVKSARELERQEVAFDLSKVHVLLDAQGKVAERWSTLARSGIAKRKEARAANNLPTSPDDDVYIPSPGVQEIRPDGTIILQATGSGQGRIPPPQQQLALPSGKDVDEVERKDREDRRDRLIMEGFKEIGRAIIEAGKKEDRNGHSGGAGFDVIRDESGRIAGIARREGNSIGKEN